MGYKHLKFPEESVFLVTGGAGFIGSNLCETILVMGYKVRCLDDLSTGKQENVDLFAGNPNYSFIKGDIKDFDTGNGIKRFRCWDSCMYSEFTKMAHGNNRLTQKERFRQRFMHKLVYYPMNNDGMFSCVGCGRCLSKCPISMNIVKVMKKLGGD